MKETSKSILRRVHDTRFATRYFVGHGIDIGCGNDCLWEYRSLFPLMESCRAWDIGDGDAQTMPGVLNGLFDFVHSSHCLEHLPDPEAALLRWINILKPGGHLVVVVPDWHLYEHRQWPSRKNPDHKCWFTPHQLVLTLPTLSHKLLKVELLDATWRSDQGEADQTLGIGECAIEMIVRKDA